MDGAQFTSLKQRKGKGIWQNLWEFPLLESKEILEIDDITIRYKEALGDIESVELLEYNENAIVHKLSHQHLHTKFWIVNTENDFDGKISIKKLTEFPVPVLIADFIKAFKF